MSQLGTMSRTEIVVDLRSLVENTRARIDAGQIRNEILGGVEGDVVLFQRLIGELDRRGLLDVLMIPPTMSDFLRDHVAKYPAGLAAVEAVALSHKYGMHHRIFREMGQNLTDKLKTLVLGTDPDEEG